MQKPPPQCVGPKQDAEFQMTSEPFETGGGGKAGSRGVSAAVLWQRSLYDGVMFKQAAYGGRMAVIGQ